MGTVLKIILFIEFMAMFVCGAMHLFMFFTKQEFPLETYPIIAGVILVAVLLMAYVFGPIGEWFLS